MKTQTNVFSVIWHILFNRRQNDQGHDLNGSSSGGV